MAVILANQPGHVANRTALLALTADQLFGGDIFIQGDNGHAYMFVGSTPSNFNDWLQLDQDLTQAELDTETAARIAADTTLQTNITAEATTARAAESSNATAISTEASARTTGDATTLSTATGRAAALAIVFGA